MNFEQKKRLLKDYLAAENRLLELSDRQYRWQQLKGKVAHPSAHEAIDGVVADFDRRIARLTALRQSIENAIDGLQDSLLRDLLELRYIIGADWDRVADSLGYSRRQTFNLHRLAIEKLNFAEDCTNCTF